MLDQRTTSQWGYPDPDGEKRGLLRDAGVLRSSNLDLTSDGVAMIESRSERRLAALESQKRA